MINFTYSQLIRVGAHLGARAKNFWFLASWMVLGVTKNFCVLDLHYSLLIFRLCSSVLRATVFFKAPIWFVNLDKTKEDYIRAGALLCGEFFCNNYWIGGLLSNYFHVFMMLRKFINTPFFMRSERLILKLTELVENWFLTRFTWPRLLFVSSAFYNMRVIKEALRTGIPCITITDTLYTTDYILFPIPGNDQSVSAVDFYNQFIASIILRLKFVNIICWFINVRQNSRLISFNEWLSLKLSTFKGRKTKNFSYSLLGRKFISTGVSLGFMRSGSYNKQYLIYFDMIFSNFNAQACFMQFVKVQNMLQDIETILFTKIWLKTGLFGIKRIRRRTKRFFCKSPKRLGVINFLQSRTAILDLMNSGGFIYITQSIFLMSLFRYYDISFFKRFKKIGWKFFKKLRPSVFFIIGTFFIFKNISIIKNPKIKQFFKKFSRFSRSAVGNFDTNILLNKFIVRRDNLWFWNVANLRFNSLWPISLELSWFFVGYLYNLKFPNLIKKFFFAPFSYSWTFIYANLWWRKFFVPLKIQKRYKKKIFAKLKECTTDIDDQMASLYTKSFHQFEKVYNELVGLLIQLYPDSKDLFTRTAFTVYFNCEKHQLVKIFQSKLVIQFDSVEAYYDFIYKCKVKLVNKINWGLKTKKNRINKDFCELVCELCCKLSMFAILCHNNTLQFDKDGDVFVAKIKKFKRVNVEKFLNSIKTKLIRMIENSID